MQFLDHWLYYLATLLQTTIQSTGQQTTTATQFNSSEHVADNLNSQLIGLTQLNADFNFSYLTLPNRTSISAAQKLNTFTSDITLNLESQNNDDSTLSTFYFLPSILFKFAVQNDLKVIVSPVVGGYVDQTKIRSVNATMTFKYKNDQQSPGMYGCYFWDAGQWDNSGCTYQFIIATELHQCTCDHLTSFALLFSPDIENHILSTSTIPCVVAAALSIICLSISVGITMYQQVQQNKRNIISNGSTDGLSRQPTTQNSNTVVSLYSSSTTLLLFVLLTILLLHTTSSAPNAEIIDYCTSDKQSLALSVYFFLILTFSSRTLLALSYFYNLVWIRVITNKHMIFGVFISFLLALIPTITAAALTSSFTQKIIIQYKTICWFNKSYLIGFVTIPVAIFVTLNILIIVIITVYHLSKAVRSHSSVMVTKQRMRMARFVCFISCITLGIAWMIGPLLSMFTSSSTSDAGKEAAQWIFTLLIGLEGVWTLLAYLVT
ncbi:unnamed protein product, partial [Didymodactylos carnosus]